MRSALGGYHCVFVCSPFVVDLAPTPYAMFVSRVQAEILTKELGKPLDWIITLDEWRESAAGKAAIKRWAETRH